MNIYVNLLFSIMLLLVLITFKVINIRKNPDNYRETLYRKSLIFNTFLYIVSLAIFVTFLIVNLKTNNVLNSIVNALSIAVLALPLSINTLYKTSFTDEEKYSHINYLITDDYDYKYIKLFNKAGINIIYLNEDSTDKTITITELSKYRDKKNVTVSSKDYKKALKLLPNSYYGSSLKEAYEYIRKCRGVHDNYIRTINFNIAIYAGLLFSVLAFLIQGFPIYYNLFNVLVFKTITYLYSEYTYKHMPYDTDLMERKPKDKNILLGTQDIIISLIEAFCICFALSIPYMFILANVGLLSEVYTILTVTIIYISIWLTYSYLSEKIFLINLIESFNNFKMLFVNIGLIVLTVIICFLPKAGFMNIGLKNYVSAILASILPIIFIEITKLARYTSKKGRKKHVKNY